jgi:hypothetical protein
LYLSWADLISDAARECFYGPSILSELGIQLQVWTLNSEHTLTVSIQHVTASVCDDEDKYNLRNVGCGHYK